MPTLQELQQQFVDALDHQSEAIYPWIKASAKLTSKKHFAIYSNSIKGIQQKVLQEVYPICCSLVGEEYFIALTNFYIGNTISQSADLGDYVTRFPQSLVSENRLPYLSDVASLELACFKLENAKENNVIDYEKLSAHYMNDGENIVFELPENSTLMRSAYPIHLIWDMHQRDVMDTTIQLHDHEEYFYLVWRDKDKLRIDFLNQAQWQVLYYFKQGFSLGKIATIEALDLMELLPILIQNNWLRGFYLQS